MLADQVIKQKIEHWQEKHPQGSQYSRDGWEKEIKNKNREVRKSFPGPSRQKQTRKCFCCGKEGQLIRRCPEIENEERLFAVINKD